MKTKTKRFKLTIDFSVEVFEALQESCHSDYWCDTKWKGNSCYIREHNAEDRSAKPGPWICLNKERRLRGLQLMAVLTPKVFGELVADDFDGNTGDVWLQLAILGEVKYG